MGLCDLIDRVEPDRRTLTVYNHGGQWEMVDDLRAYFAHQHVSVDVTNDDTVPRGLVVLHDDGDTLAAGRLDDIHRALHFDPALVSADGFDQVTYPTLLRHVDDTSFAAYGKRRMVLASREIEELAWRTRGGVLRSGFQRLSVFRDQWPLYADIGRRGVETHVYGQPDWHPPRATDFVLHAHEDDELGSAWFVVFRSDTRKAALLAEEVSQCRFRGVWTYDPDIVDDVAEYVHTTWDAVSPHQWADLGGDR